MVELMSKIIRNAPAGRLGEGNRIEQKEVFVQFRGGQAGEGSCFDKMNFPVWALTVFEIFILGGSRQDLGELIIYC